VVCAVLLLGGCASTWRVDNRVESFARWSDAGATATGGSAIGTDPAAVPQAPQNYRFERLPSQREGEAAAGQAALESLTSDVFATLGWTLADGTAPAGWTVQVSASGQRRARSAWNDGWPHVWPLIGLGIGSHGTRISAQWAWNPWYPHPYLYPEPPDQHRKVSVVVRHAATGRVVYETHAVHDGRWNDSPALWRAMVTAALRDFPAPPGGVRRVDIDLPR
jgi:hypothetical protein